MTGNSVSSRFKAERVEQAIREKIRANTWAPGTYIPSERELVEMFSVSRMTVRKGLERLREGGLLESVPGRGTRVAELRDHDAPQVGGTYCFIGQVEGPVTHVMGGILSGIESHLSRHGAGLLIKPILLEAGMELSVLLPGPPDGIFYFPTVSPYPIRMIQDWTLRHGLPLVVLDRLPEVEPDYGVSIDNALGGRMIGKRLYESGHRRVAALAPELSLNLVERIEGVRYALTERGLPPEAVLTAPPLSKEEFAAGWEAFHREHPDITAVFCANSHVGYNFLEYAGRTGLAIPQALSVVGFDEPIAPIRALTAVRQPTQAIGQAAAKLMLELSASRPGRVDYPPPQRILLAPELEEGDTLAPPPSAPPQD